MYKQENSQRRTSVSFAEVKAAGSDLRPLLEELLPPEGRVAGLRLLRDLSDALERLEMATAELRLAVRTDDKGRNVLSLRVELEIEQDCAAMEFEVCDTALPGSSLETRTANVLARGNVHTVVDLLDKTEAELRQIRGFGDTMNYEVQAFLKSHGLRLRGA